jgi:glycine/D-amino acid oxidase-like deaminating enzyme
MGRPPEGFAEAPLIEPCGLILVADRARAERLAGWVAAAGPHGGGHEIPADEFRRRAPFYRGEVVRAFLFPEEGCLDIAALVAGFARGARAGGIEIRTGQAVQALWRDGDRVAGVELAGGGRIAAATTVVAAGGWAGALGRAAGSRLRFTPTRRHLLTTAPDGRIDPAWPVLWALGDDFYCRPESGGMLLCACDQVEVEPGECRSDDEVCAVIAEKAERLLPDLADAGAARFWCGLRTLTFDDRFAIGPDPDVDGLFWVAGLGGHGMVCSFEIGRLAARRLAGGPPADDVERALDPGRPGLRD